MEWMWLDTDMHLKTQRLTCIGIFGPSRFRNNGLSKQLVQENTRLKKIVAERDLEIEVMNEITAKNVWSTPLLQAS